MNALKDFGYNHKESVVVNTSLGQIRLTYINRQKEWKESVLNILDVDEPPKIEGVSDNAVGYFEAVLLNDNGDAIEFHRHDAAIGAVKEIYKSRALITMANENL